MFCLPVNEYIYRNTFELSNWLILTYVQNKSPNNKTRNQQGNTAQMQAYTTGYIKLITDMLGFMEFLQRIFVGFQWKIVVISKSSIIQTRKTFGMKTLRTLIRQLFLFQKKTSPISTLILLNFHILFIIPNFFNKLHSLWWRNDSLY